MSKNAFCDPLAMERQEISTEKRYHHRNIKTPVNGVQLFRHEIIKMEGQTNIIDELAYYFNQTILTKVGIQF